MFSKFLHFPSQLISHEVHTVQSLKGTVNYMKKPTYVLYKVCWEVQGLESQRKQKIQSRWVKFICFLLLNKFLRYQNLLNSPTTLRLGCWTSVLRFVLEILNLIWESHTVQTSQYVHIDLYFSPHAPSNGWLCTMSKSQRKLQQSEISSLKMKTKPNYAFILMLS